MIFISESASGKPDLRPVCSKTKMHRLHLLASSVPICHSTLSRRCYNHRKSRRQMHASKSLNDLGSSGMTCDTETPWSSLMKEQLLSTAWRNPRHHAKARADRVASFLPSPMFFCGSNSSEKLSIFCLVGAVYCFNYFLSALLRVSSKLGSQIVRQWAAVGVVGLQRQDKPIRHPLGSGHCPGTLVFSS